jgi:hypothetical protein
MTITRIKRWTLAGFVVLSGAATGVGGLAGVAQARTSHGTKHHTKHHTRHKTHRSMSGGIPQHNGGDHDPDNNGAPSDGDGNQ